MLRIYKYELPIDDEVTVTMRQPSTALHVAEQDMRLYVWAIVDDEAYEQRRMFHIRGTGHPVGVCAFARHIGTVQMSNGLVWHVFEGMVVG